MGGGASHDGAPSAMGESAGSLLGGSQTNTKNMTTGGEDDEKTHFMHQEAVQPIAALPSGLRVTRSMAAAGIT